ncbi:S41 family peptidase [Virgibacillus sp. 179-BFC.A HS]|uniref:S41 family peptidase n=1 Tax=Tigheibacillus jepli TaxID=3035914 RepID=A0ABU5CFP2_9BACI|nr:S41 family peptidase [Virgibacillus sp. 179-BFC.A HS]MDY0405106.1 S41 family peptidase [Virgibacillus sp. 179-BFC.A HS]
MKINKIQIAVLLVAAIALGFAGAYFGVTFAQSNQKAEPSTALSKTEDPVTQDNVQTPEEMEKVAQAYSLIKKHYVQNVDDDKLIEGAIKGMLSSLDDPYSTYMDKKTMSQFNEQIESSFEGIGAEVSMRNGVVTIVSPIKDSPAEKAGLRPNDQVLRVNGKSLDGLNLDQAVAKIRGKKGTMVKLDIKRPGASDILKVNVKRDTIPVETVYSEMKKKDGKKTGVIEITSFSEHTAKEFKEQLTKLEKQGMDGLVIDVRGNPGGLLDSVGDILGNFIPSDVPYVQVENRAGEKQKSYTDLDKKKPYPIDVLMDEGSASASEILAVAMKENGYQTIGTKSFGKGTVQQAVPMGDGSTVKLTFYKWLSPKGNWIHKKGIQPDVKVKQPAYYFANPIEIKKPLAFDHTGEKIKNAQEMLAGLGYPIDRKDGYFDKQTETAVKAFQKDNKLTQSGKIDDKTAAALQAKIVDKIRSKKDDKQLQKALQVLYR